MHLKAIITYDSTTEVEVNQDQMEITQWYEEDCERVGPVIIQPDELRDIVALAKLQGWEGF